jgi:DNA-binding MarR family transcriptional regulator
VTHTIGATASVRSTTRRQRLTNDLVNELTSWNPRELIGAFRKWHRGELSLIHLNVLTLLDVNGPMPMSRLAEALDVSVASATGIVGRMEERGFVERRHDVADRRVVLVTATDAAADVFRDIDQHRRDGLRRLLGRLSDDEIAGLLDGHRALRAARAAMVADATEPAGETREETGR